MRPTALVVGASSRSLLPCSSLWWEPPLRSAAFAPSSSTGASSAWLPWEPPRALRRAESSKSSTGSTRGAPGEVAEGRSRNWVYADGRLISDRSSSGLIEQRLSPEGLELLRSEILSTGQFSHEPPPPPPGPPCPNSVSPGAVVPPATVGCVPPQPLPPPGEPLETPFGITIAVRDVGRLSRVDRASDLYRLEERLTHPASWLPASAWVDREIRAYVPTTYAVCYGGWPPDQPIEPSRLLTLLPPAAEDLLGAKDTTRNEGLFGSPGDFHVVVDHCSDVTNEEAHMLAQVFDDAGFEPFMPGPGWGTASRLQAQNEKNAQIYFEPYLPHGESDLLGMWVSDRVLLKGERMKARVVALVALAAAVTLTSIAAAGPDAAKQRVAITMKDRGTARSCSGHCSPGRSSATRAR